MNEPNLKRVTAPYTGEPYNQCEGQRNLGRCTTNVKDNQSSFSKKMYGKNLCWDCQQFEKTKSQR